MEFAVFFGDIFDGKPQIGYPSPTVRLDCSEKRPVRISDTAALVKGDIECLRSIAGDKGVVSINRYQTRRPSKELTDEPAAGREAFEPRGPYLHLP